MSAAAATSTIKIVVEPAEPGKYGAWRWCVAFVTGDVEKAWMTGTTDAKFRAWQMAANALWIAGETMGNEHTRELAMLNNAGVLKNGATS